MLQTPCPAALLLRGQVDLPKVAQAVLAVIEFPENVERSQWRLAPLFDLRCWNLIDGGLVDGKSWTVHSTDGLLARLEC